MDTRYNLLRFIEAQGQPVNWYRLRHQEVDGFGNPANALKSLANEGLLHTADGQNYQLTDQGRRYIQSHQAELAARLEALKQGRFTGDALLSALQDFGQEHYLEARSTIEGLLTDSNPLVRALALQTLVGVWRLTDERYQQVARAFLEKDPDRQCRIVGAATLATLARLGAGKNDSPALRALAKVVNDTHQDGVVRQVAYSAMQSILRGDPTEMIKRGQQRLEDTSDVDWALVQAYA